MSPQLLELIIFAGIAILVIAKLLSKLGSYSEDDPMKNKNYFGEKPIKDVTSSINSEQKIVEISQYLNKQEFLDKNNTNDILKGLQEIKEKLKNPIDLESFIKKSKIAFDLIIDSLLKDDQDTLSKLVDKRFITRLKQEKFLYQNINKADIKILISEVYSFGNNCFIKIKLSNSDENFAENWVFNKSSLENTNIWYLSNIERD